MELSVGDMAPDFILESVWNESFSLGEETKRSNVLLYFYVVNYGRTCTEYMQEMNERKDLLDRLNVRLVHVNPDSVENHAKWMERTDSKFDHLSDAGQIVSKRYGAIIERAKAQELIGRTNREFFLIGTDGKIRYIWKAFFPTDTIRISELAKEIEKVL